MSSEFHIGCNAALGWLELGNWQEAYNELESLPAAQRAHPDALKLYCRVWEMAGRWEELALIAEGATEAFPAVSEFMWQFAWSQWKLGELEPWMTALLSQATRFPRDSEFNYRLACLLSAARRFVEARAHLALAFESASNERALKLRALEQPELEGLWGEVREY